MKKIKTPDEWFKQADYDLGTAEAMFKTGKFIYTVFMCHLAAEKALKGIYTKKLNKNAPKSHDLIYIVEEAELKLPDFLRGFAESLSDLSVPTRYPEELELLLRNYTKGKVKKILTETRKILAWLKENL